MAAHILSTSQELNPSSESLSSNASTSDNLCTCSSEEEEEEEEEEVRYKNNIDDSDECECDQCYSGTMASCYLRIRLSTSQELNTSSESLSSNSSTLDNSFTCSSEEEEVSVQELEEQLNEKDQNTTDKTKAIHSLENKCKMIQELEETLNEKDKEIKEKNNTIAALENQCQMIQELEETLNEKDKEIKEKNNTIAALENQYRMECAKLEEICKTNNERIQELKETPNEKDKDVEEKSNVIAALEKQCKMIKELEEILNEKDKDIKEKSNAIAALEKQCKLESQKLEEIYKTNNERIHKLEEKLCKKEREITAKNQAVATLESQCEINEKEVMKIQTQYNFEIMQNKKVQGEQASEIKRLQKYEEIHPAIQAELVDLQKKLDNYQATLAKANDKIKQLTNELRTAGKEKDELLHRLSKIAGAKLTYNNPNIADLSDQKRPTKLAEEFAELYDNEWTDAFEDVDIESDEDKVAYMLSLLKTAYELCKKASQNHMEKMRSSICKLTLGAKQTYGEKHKTSKTKCGEVVFDYEKFQDEQKKAVMDLGKFVEIKLSTEFEKIVVDYIASEYCIDKNNRKKLYVYTQKCVNICWSMCRLEIPVAMGLQEVYDRMPLDTSVFKAYTKSGKFVDYIVWPPLYLHENGPLLCKGVAQGKA